MSKNVGGTFEWAKYTDNCAEGCEHHCRYCYARYGDVVRWRKVKAEDWSTPRVIAKKVQKRRKKLDGVVMFPTRHDIVPSILDACIKVLCQHIALGNHVLIVSKPHAYCIGKIVTKFGAYADQILFRFTIGSTLDSRLGFWEPGAPSYDERKTCLKIARMAGFQTSVSAEPLLDNDAIGALALVNDLAPHVSHSIWIGQLNKAKQRLRLDDFADGYEVDRLLGNQTEENIRQIYEVLKDHPLVRWKDSCRKVLGLPLAENPELSGKVG